MPIDSKFINYKCLQMRSGTDAWVESAASMECRMPVLPPGRYAITVLASSGSALASPPGNIQPCTWNPKLFNPAPGILNYSALHLESSTLNPES